MKKARIEELRGLMGHYEGTMTESFLETPDANGAVRRMIVKSTPPPFVGVVLTVDDVIETVNVVDRETGYVRQQQRMTLGYHSILSEIAKDLKETAVSDEAKLLAAKLASGGKASGESLGWGAYAKLILDGLEMLELEGGRSGELFDPVPVDKANDARVLQLDAREAVLTSMKEKAEATLREIDTKSEAIAARMAELDEKLALLRDATKVAEAPAAEASAEGPASAAEVATIAADNQNKDQAGGAAAGGGRVREARSKYSA